MAATAVHPGSVVALRYRLFLDDGSAFGHTGSDRQFEYLHGAGQILPELEQVLAGRHTGERLVLEMAADRAFGPYRPEAVTTIARRALPDGAELVPGALLQGTDASGQAMLGTVRSVDDRTVVLDLNHPLAGRDLCLEIQIEDVRAASQGEQLLWRQGMR